MVYYKNKQNRSLKKVEMQNINPHKCCFKSFVQVCNQVHELIDEGNHGQSACLLYDLTMWDIC